MLITVSAVMHRELQGADALVHEGPAGVFRQPVPKMEADRPLPKPTTETLLVNARASRKKRMKALEKGDRYVLGKIRQGEGG